MNWFLSALGLTRKDRKLLKSVSHVAKMAVQPESKTDLRVKSRSKGKIVDLEDLPYDEYEIVGEAMYQAALEKHAGPKTESGVSVRCEVRLVCERNNKFDKNAVRVEIGSDTVGYLSKTDAKFFRTMLQEEGFSGASVRARAIINGGWLSQTGDGHYGIVLDFDYPDDHDVASRDEASR